MRINATSAITPDDANRIISEERHRLIERQQGAVAGRLSQCGTSRHGSNHSHAETSQRWGTVAAPPCARVASHCERVHKFAKITSPNVTNDTARILFYFEVWSSVSH